MDTNEMLERIKSMSAEDLLNDLINLGRKDFFTLSSLEQYAKQLLKAEILTRMNS